MNKILSTLAVFGLGAQAALAADPSLTIYNENFAVVRDSVPLDLQDGVTDVTFAEMTAHLEPDSVILRDPTGKVNWQILEQNYRNDPVSQELLLSLNEGKTIDFVVKEPGQPDRTIQVKIIRSGYGLHSQMAMQQCGQQYYQTQMAYAGGASGQPIIDVDGKLQFGLPGQPIFPSLGDGTILKPALQWKLQSSGAAKVDAEIAYITAGMSWKADYNIVAAPDSDLLDLVGWITMNNQSGKSFSNAKIKLMAGDVNKIQNVQNFARVDALQSASVYGAARPVVTEKGLRGFSSLFIAAPDQPPRRRDEAGRVRPRFRHPVPAHLRLRRCRRRLDPVLESTRHLHLAHDERRVRGEKQNQGRNPPRIQKFRG